MPLLLNFLNWVVTQKQVWSRWQIPKTVMLLIKSNSFIEQFRCFRYVHVSSSLWGPDMICCLLVGYQPNFYNINSYLFVACSLFCMWMVWIGGLQHCMKMMTRLRKKKKSLKLLQLIPLPFCLARYRILAKNFFSCLILPTGTEHRTMRLGNFEIWAY